ncbi:MAG: FlgD immunoglobulin-like domain containing protein [Candidatus Komeilibacteria bacterium]
MFRLIEKEIIRNNQQRTLVHGTAVPANPTPVSKETPNKDPRAILESNLQMRMQVQGSSMVTKYGIAIVCPEEWVDEVEQYVAGYARSTGWTVLVHAVTADPADPEAFRSATKSLFAQDYAQGYRALWLIGGAGDEWYLDPSKWPAGHWTNKRNSYIASGYIPKTNWIPTWYIADLADDNVAMSAPYLFSDDPYIEGLPDAMVCRWSADNENELLSLAVKWQYCSMAAMPGGGPYSVVVFLGNGEYDNPGDSALVETYGQMVAAKLTGNYVRWFRQSQHPIDSQRNYAASQYLYDTHLAIAIASGSTRYSPGNMFNVMTESTPWTPWMIPEGSYQGQLLAVTCNTAAFSRAEHPDYGRDVGSVMLNQCDRGPDNLIGPSQGSNHYADIQLALANIDHLMAAQGTQTKLECFWAAKREVLAQNSADADIVKTLVSTFFLGDPTTGLNRLAYQTWVPEDEPTPKLTQLGLARPNPMTTDATIYFQLARPCQDIQLRIFDISGRLVRTLRNDPELQAGTYANDWNGQDDSGRHVGAGIYCYQLAVAGQPLPAHKLILVR